MKIERIQKSTAPQQAIEQLYLPSFNVPDATIKKLIRELKVEKRFDMASKLLERLVQKHPNDLGLAQEFALCTYKNEEEPTDYRYSKAADILIKAEADMKTTRNLETLGLMGAIYKKKWKHDNQLRNLRISRNYYMRAYLEWIKFKKEEEEQKKPNNVFEQDKNIDDNGFNAINTVYLTDLLAYLSIVEARSNRDDALEELAKSRLEEANEIRHQLIHYLPNTTKLMEAAIEEATDQQKEELLSRLYWVYATLAEAHFGLHEFEQAAVYLKKAKNIKGENSWEYESFARQLATLTQIHIDIHSDESNELEKQAKASLKALLNKDAAIEAIFIGKVGLALSGGGFRASLFHIGMLARLAEMDILRHVEVLSCVSGGSIIGAYYYLELKKMLEQKKDEEITQQDYIDLVKRIEEQFLQGIQSNLRVRIFGSVSAIFKLIFSGSYTTSMRLAELYEKYLYEPLLADSQKSLKMKDLVIKVPDDPDFNIKRDNWTRQNKVPNLVINATPLNTGHNWQFTPGWMGEPPGSIIPEIDSKPRLRQMTYDQAPGKYKNIQLGEAVAASSGVPGVIEPLELDELYKNNFKAQLVDGGVHDNQGIVGLLAEECQVLFLSDASGQLTVDSQRLNSLLGILSRSLSILMDRVRECEYLDLRSRLESNLIKGMMFVHMHKGLKVEPLGWLNEKEFPPMDHLSKVTEYGVNRSLQKLLASMRTDLDAFNDREAYALMYSAYQMTKYQHQITTKSIFKNSKTIEGNWDFMSVAKEMSAETPPEIITQQLTISQQTFNKYLGFYPTWRKTLKGLFLGGTGAVLLSSLYFLRTDFMQQIVPFLGMSVLVMLTLILAPFVLRRLFRIFGWRLNTKLFRVALTIFGLGLFVANQMTRSNWLYLRKGKVKK